MKRLTSALIVLLLVFGMSFSAYAYARNSDAAVYADFDGADMQLGVGQIPANTPVFLNGMDENSTASLVGGALKVEFSNGGFICLGQDNVKIRDLNTGKVNYQYMVIRIKGEVGNENRTEAGGLLLFIGGGDGSHAITLNDRPTGVAPCATDASGKPMNAISTGWQEFAIKLSDSNVRPEKEKCTGLNINTVSTAATLYIDDIYFTNKAPKTAAVYDSSKSTAAITKAQAQAQNQHNAAAASDIPSGTVISGDNTASAPAEGDNGTAVDPQTGVARLDPPSNTNTYVATTVENDQTASWISVIACAVLLVVLTAVFALIYFKIVLKKKK